MVPVALATSAALVWNASYAAFSATAPTQTNTVTAGTVAIGNSPATAILNVSGPIPGSFGETCVVTTYTGTLPADVRIYLKAADITGTLAPHLTLQVEEGAGASSSCSDFSGSATLYNTTGWRDTTKTVTAFSAAANTYATGVSRWIATTGGTRTYRFFWQLQDDNAARSLSTTVTFTWEAQST